LKSCDYDHALMKVDPIATYDVAIIIKNNFRNKSISQISRPMTNTRDGFGAAPSENP